ncbi:MAG: CRISPR-associated endonuclease Cas6 [Candidatus Neomarinimicrobiota bacterium]|nr:CRISPR-associated endonuclease Cas6 [Candidatus Neomarinimicrobiota bacterium]
MVSNHHSSIKSIVSRLSTDKPVRKTSYQVKGVLMREFPNDPLIPFINGSYRNDYLYPRVQVKILDEQIYLLGIEEGFEPVESLVKNLNVMNFGNITFQVEGVENEVLDINFSPSEKSIYYEFLTPWIALNKINLKRYRTFGKSDEERTNFLRRLLSQNIAFIGKELGLSLDNKIFVDITLDTLKPRIMDEGKNASFEGGFSTNYVLPNYIGVGNGITKGFGVLYSELNPSEKGSEDGLTKVSADSYSDLEELPQGWEEDAIDPNDIPRSKRQKRSRDDAEPDDAEPKEPNFNTTKYHSKTH